MTPLTSARKLFTSLNSLRRKISRRVIRLLGGITREEHNSSLQHVHAELLEQIHLLHDRTEHLKHCHNETVAWANANSRQNSSALPSFAGEETLVSVIMPVWNRERVVGSAIESVLNQTWKNWELIILDDGSEDGTREVVQQYSDDPRIRLLSLPHRGVCVARNHGLENCNGDFVAYLDSDNRWYPNHLELIVENLLHETNYSCGYATQYVYDVSRKMSYLRGREFEREFFSKHGGIDLNTFVHRIALYHQHGGFDETLTRLVDWDLISRYLQNTLPLFVSDVTNYYEESRPDSITANEDFQSNAAIVQGKMSQESGQGKRNSDGSLPQVHRERKAS